MNQLRIRIYSKIERFTETLISAKQFSSLQVKQNQANQYHTGNTLFNRNKKREKKR